MNIINLNLCLFRCLPKQEKMSHQDDNEPQFDESYYQPVVDWNKKFARKLRNPTRFVLFTTATCLTLFFAYPVYLAYNWSQSKPKHLKPKAVDSIVIPPNEE